MNKRTNIAMHVITNGTMGLNIYYLFKDDLLLNSGDERKNKGINKGNDNVFFEEKLTTTDINL